MPLLKLKRIVSCSSQDPAFPAENLLQSNTNKKWKCKSGETSATVVFQLEKSSLITQINIGNEGSAFIEVLVGRESVPDDFKVILVMSSFMTPMDARNEVEKNRVRMFNEDHLNDSVASEKWDRVKVVCTQPFNKHLQYGLSFINLHEPDEVKGSDSGTSARLGRFSLKEEDGDITAGSIFARRKEEPELPPKLPPPAATWRDIGGASASPKAGPAKKNTAKKNTTPKNTPGKPLVAKDNNVPKNSPTNDPSTSNATKAPAKKIAPKKDGSPSPAPRTPTAKRPHSDEGTSGRERKQAKLNPNVIYKPFNKLMEDVEFAISGYINPGRAEIRSKALEMGARYRPDWTSTCTHLVCAFANTPKSLQVKGKGKIILRDWVDDCHRERKVLPWRRYAVHVSDKTAAADSNEKEIWELVEETRNTQSVADRRNAMSSESTNMSTSQASQDDSDSDTDDEINRIVQQKKKAATAKEKEVPNGVASSQKLNSKKEPDISEVDRSVYDVSTDCDSGEESESSKSVNLDDLPELLSIFSDKSFYLHPSLPEMLREQLTRYITAFCGTLSKDLNEDVNFVIAKRRGSVKEDTHGATLVRPDWVWECNDRGSLISTEDYEL